MQLGGMRVDEVLERRQVAHCDGTRRGIAA